MSNLLALAPIGVFFILLLVVSLISSYKANQATHFKKEYFLGSQNLGGVVLAMTLVATYGSVSSFISGPGVAWDKGFSWVVFAAPQIITGFLILGVLGKRMTLLTNRLESLTVIDIIYERFHSKILCFILAVLLILFFFAMIVGQFVGGAQIFAGLTNIDYSLGLILFAFVTTLYSSGGFRAVAITDTICAILMLVGMFILGYIILIEADGFTNISNSLSSINPNENGISPQIQFDAGGKLPLGLLFSAWILVGFATIGLPQSLIRCMSYRSTQDLHKSMLIATVVCGALMIGMTLIGVFARAVITELPKGGTDVVIPTLISEKMHPLVAGITILGPLAATMSTVSSLLIAASSAIIRDLLKALHKDRRPKSTYIKDQSINSTSCNNLDTPSNNLDNLDNLDNQVKPNTVKLENNKANLTSSSKCAQTTLDTLAEQTGSYVNQDSTTNSDSLIKDAVKKDLSYHEKLIIKGTTLVFGVLAIVLALFPVDIVVWINLFAFGGLECAFVWTIVLGLFSTKTNTCGILCSIVASLGCYLCLTLTKISILQTHAIVPSLACGLIAAIIGSYYGRYVLKQKMNRDTHSIFFPHRKFED